MMLESVILVMVGGFLGVIGTLAATLVNYRLRQEERRSDRRRDLYERELNIVRDSVNAVIEAEAAIWVVPWQEVDWKSRLQSLLEVAKQMDRAVLVAGSLDDQELTDKCMELRGHFSCWLDLLDMKTGRAEKGKEKEFEELREQLKVTGALVWRRTRAIPEEV